MGGLIPSQSLAFPGGSPGYDPGHVAATQSMRYSGVAQAGSFLNILTAGRATISGSPVAKTSDIGPTVDFTGSNNYLTVSGIIENMLNCTMAAIVRPTTSVASGFQYFFVTGSRSSPNVGLVMNGSQFKYWNNGNGSNTDGVNFTTNDPYFVAVSSFQNAGTALVQVSLVMNMRTGISRTAAFLGGRGNQQTSGAASYTIGGFSGFNSSAQMAAVMMSAAPLSLAQLVQWSQSPWSFWYPQTRIRGLMNSGLRSSTGAGASNSNLLLLGVG